MNVNDKNFLDEKDLRFVTFRRVLDSRMKELLSKGFRTKVKRADPLSLQDEENLWQKGVFGMTNSVSLQHTAFFYACKLFGLRGRDEHRNLDCSQLEIGTDQTGKYVRFIGRSTKTFKGGLSHLSLDNKDIKHYSEEGPRCIATHFQKYLEALGNDGIFYRKPRKGNSEQTIRYGKQAVGINKLDLFMKEICQKGGIQGNFSNHSGKRTCATQLYQAGIEEQEIKGRTGHRSNAVRTYKTSNETIQKKVSNVLNPPLDATETAEVSFFDENSSDEPTIENTSVLATPPMKRQRTTPEMLKDVTNTKGGQGEGGRTEAFRKWFGNIGELRSLFPEATQKQQTRSEGYFKNRHYWCNPADFEDEKVVEEVVEVEEVYYVALTPREMSQRQREEYVKRHPFT
ncbi:uncharacterized protein LOC134717755 [Mytilus trossulus]|uniref:uncharacterized protein LOC134717755 n=1 Tax=Mytilus trossulus TaxID=6551 RepID=UPI003005D30B